MHESCQFVAVAAIFPLHVIYTTIILDTQAAETDMEAMKTQAEATKREYDRLMTEMTNLQNEFCENNKKDD